VGDELLPTPNCSSGRIMMRAEVELKDIDIQLLKRLCEAQAGLLESHKALSSEWSQ
jgi:hypothetical protein